MNAIQAPLTHWLRLLWDTAPALHLNSDCPYIAQGAIHLPPRRHWRNHMAAAAHAAAHLVYSPSRYDGAGMGTVVRALMALLEDARVETLAMRELPGLARLWRPLHTATPLSGSNFDALMQRLARTLIDPDYDDPEPWVRKGRELFFLDQSLGLPALRTPAELRTAAQRLGHDIGQMRLTFNAKTYRPVPDYRDDHRWMWDAQALQDEPPPRVDPVGTDTRREEDSASSAAVPHPEWDRLIERLRPNWCHVQELAGAPAGERVEDLGVRAAARHLGARLRSLPRHDRRTQRAFQGERFDVDALLNWRLACRLRHPGDARVYRAACGGVEPTAVWLLVDQSASSAARHSDAEGSVLRLASRAAGAAALALQSRGVRCAIFGFSSNGRHDVRLRTVKSVADPLDGTVLARLASLRADGSTRLGAAVRHASRGLSARGEAVRWIWLFSDAQAHDVDVHDPRYLVEDARHAVQAAARRSIRTLCWVVAGEPGADARRIFGARCVVSLAALRDFPGTARRLLQG